MWGESEVWVIEKFLNKIKDLIQKMKEVLGFFNRDTVSFESKKKKIPDLSLPPCICKIVHILSLAEHARKFVPRMLSVR